MTKEAPRSRNGFPSRATAWTSVFAVFAVSACTGVTSVGPTSGAPQNTDIAKVSALELNEPNADEAVVAMSAPEPEPEPQTRGPSFNAAAELDQVDVRALGNLFAPIVKVNGDIITGYDVRQRAALIAFSAEADPGAEPVLRLALEELVADALRTQEAELLGLEVGANDIERALAQVAGNNNTDVDGMLGALAEVGVERATLERQIVAQMTWNTILTGRYGDRARPTAADIDAALAATAPQGRIIDLAQIIVPLAPNAGELDVQAAFGRAVSARGRINGCPSVQEAAESVGLRAEAGAVVEADMPPAIIEALKNAPDGQPTPPMRSQQGIHLIVRCGYSDGPRQSRERVAQQLMEQSLQRYSASMLDNLRRNAVIEVR